MPTLEELLKEFGYDSSGDAPGNPRGKLLAQADRLLNELAKYKSNSELNSKSTKYWWAPQAVNGKRKITVRYANKAVQNFSHYANDTIDDVKRVITDFKSIIEKSDDATWAAEEARRKDSK